MTAPTVRLATPEDRDFLPRALLWAADWRDEGGLSVAEIAARPDAWHYVDGWMRPDDFGVVAESSGIPVGAAWARVMPVDDPGYGFVDATVPELTIGVAPDHRGIGAGRVLMAALLAEARTRNRSGVSLSVEDGNVAARRLYERCGFRVVGRSGDSDTMVIWF